MLCFFPLVSRAEMSLSISANTNFYEYIQMQFLHIVVETVLNSRQRTFLDLVDSFCRERATVSTLLMGRLRYPALDCAEVTTSTFLIPASISKGSTDQCLIVVAKLIFGKLKVLISGSELGLSVTEPKKLSHHSMSHLWDSLSCHFSKIEQILGLWLISSDILVSMDANWKESGKGELTSGNTPIEVSFASKVPFLQYFQFTFKNQVCAPKTSSLVQDSCTSQANEQILIVHLR